VKSESDQKQRKQRVAIRFVFRLISVMQLLKYSNVYLWGRDAAELGHPYFWILATRCSAQKGGCPDFPM